MPPSASSNAPARARSAPVNAPFSWPNSSLSSRFAGTAPQSTTTNGPAARGSPGGSPRQRVLAGAGLALDQHGGVGRGDAPGEREQPAHRRRPPPQPPKRRVGQRQLAPIRRALEAHLRLPELQRRAARARSLRAPRRLDAAAVGRAEIAQQRALRRQPDDAVVARHRRIGEPQVRAVGAADQDLVLLQRHGLPLVGALEHLQPHLRKGERARAGERPWSPRRAGAWRRAHRDSAGGVEIDYQRRVLLGFDPHVDLLAPQLRVLDRDRARPARTGKRRMGVVPASRPLTWTVAHGLALTDRVPMARGAAGRARGARGVGARAGARAWRACPCSCSGRGGACVVAVVRLARSCDGAGAVAMAVRARAHDHDEGAGGEPRRRRRAPSGCAAASGAAGGKSAATTVWRRGGSGGAAAPRATASSSLARARGVTASPSRRRPGSNSAFRRSRSSRERRAQAITQRGRAAAPALREHQLVDRVGERARAGKPLSRVRVERASQQRLEALEPFEPHGGL